MKEYITIIVIFSVLLLATPLMFDAFAQGESALMPFSEKSNDSPQELVFPEKVSLLVSESGEIIRLSMEDYLIGCLFAQIPPDYHEEALKAQAVAAHTYAIRLMQDRQSSNSDFYVETTSNTSRGVSRTSATSTNTSTSTSPQATDFQIDFQITDNPTTCQPFFTEEKAKERYGDRYDDYYKKIRAAAKHGASRIILHNDEPIYAVYHSLSAGVTNTAYTVWGRDFPYLKSVESSWDREHPDFLCVNEITAESIRLAMFRYNKTASMPVDYSLWFDDVVKNDFGYVLSVKAGETLLSGGDMWRIFDLRSTAFEVSFKDSEVFVVETRGFGHGAGMSQYGANVLGGRGFSSDEILQHYYSDVGILDLNS